MSYSNQDNLSKLRSEIFSEPTSKDVRPHVVSYVKAVTSEAEKLSREQLIGKEGHGLAVDITSALAFKVLRALKGMIG